MLAVSPAATCAADAEQRVGVAGMETVVSDLDLGFDFSVDDIDFGDFFLRLEDGDALPDLEVDPSEIFTDFEAVAKGGEEVRDQKVPGNNELLVSAAAEDVGSVSPCGGGVIGEENAAFAAEAGEKKNEECNHAEEGSGDFRGDRAVVEEAKSPSSTTSSSQEAESRHKSSSKNSHGKKKAKVDWTPEVRAGGGAARQ